MISAGKVMLQTSDRGIVVSIVGISPILSIVFTSCGWKVELFIARKASLTRDKRAARIKEYESPQSQMVAKCLNLRLKNICRHEWHEG